jgi:hypothetical protein
MHLLTWVGFGLLGYVPNTLYYDFLACSHIKLPWKSFFKNTFGLQLKPSQSKLVQDRSGDGWSGFPKLPHLSGRSKPLHRRNTSGQESTEGRRF